MPTALIIGAGMTGLTAARELTRRGWTVILLDKGRGVGGRLATRRLDRGRADHGAQYFSAKTPPFQEAVQDWLRRGVVREWPLPDRDGTRRHPRYVGTDGLNALAKHLAQGLDVRTGERVTYLRQADGSIQVDTETGQTYEADALVLTLPVPQALTLLADSGIDLTPEPAGALRAIRYEPCLAVMAMLSEPTRIAPPGGLRLTDGPVAWVADNAQKGISPDQPTVTLHASHPFSQAHLEDNLEAVGRQLLDGLPDLIPPSTVQSIQVHRWRYSHATGRHPEPFLAVTHPFPMLFGGDGFGMGNIEGAFLSGLAMAHNF